MIAYSDNLTMSISLLGDPDDPADDIALSNPQRLLVSPFAMWSRNAADFDVANDLEVGNDVVVGRQLITGGSLDVGGTDIILGKRDGRDQGPSKRGQRALVHIGADQLYLNFEGDFEGGTTINSDTRVTGTLDFNNRVGAGEFDGFNDYSLLLYRGNTARESFGIGVESGTLSFNTNDDFKFYENGTLRLHIDNDTLRVPGNTRLGDGGTDNVTIIGAEANGSAGGLTIKNTTTDPNMMHFDNDEIDTVNNTLKLNTNTSNAVVVGGEFIASNNDFGSNGSTFNACTDREPCASSYDDPDGDCVWEGYTAGTTTNDEHLSNRCSGGRFVAGYRRWHGSFDYGIEVLELWCCRL